jgi:hypothetical protein
MTTDAQIKSTERDLAQSKQSAWDRVYTAIVERWPEIDQLELLECEQKVESLVEYVRDRVQSGADEVASVVSEFAPQAPSMAAAVGETASDVIDRMHYEIDEAPVKSSLAGVLFGFSLGVIATTLYSNACRKDGSKLLSDAVSIAVGLS